MRRHALLIVALLTWPLLLTGQVEAQQPETLCSLPVSDPNRDLDNPLHRHLGRIANLTMFPEGPLVPADESRQLADEEPTPASWQLDNFWALGGTKFVDVNGTTWDLQAAHFSVFHQPTQELWMTVIDTDGPFGALGVETGLDIKRPLSWKEYPYRKLVSEPDASGGSYEVVIAPIGVESGGKGFIYVGREPSGDFTPYNFVVDGKLGGTYNYQPAKTLGGIPLGTRPGHYIEDVLPHLTNSDYQPLDNRSVLRRNHNESEGAFAARWQSYRQRLDVLANLVSKGPTVTRVPRTNGGADYELRAGTVEFIVNRDLIPVFERLLRYHPECAPQAERNPLSCGSTLDGRPEIAVILVSSTASDSEAARSSLDALLSLASDDPWMRSIQATPAASVTVSELRVDGGASLDQVVASAMRDGPAMIVTDGARAADLVGRELSRLSSVPATTAVANLPSMVHLPVQSTMLNGPEGYGPTELAALFPHRAYPTSDASQNSTAVADLDAMAGTGPTPSAGSSPGMSGPVAESTSLSELADASHDIHEAQLAGRRALPMSVTAIQPGTGSYVTTMRSLLQASESEICDDDDNELFDRRGSEPALGGSFGHPNLVTFDGLSFQFHGAGDYLLMRSTTPGDNLRVVARFSRLASMLDVSYNRALLIESGATTITIGDIGSSSRPDGIGPFDQAPIHVGGKSVVSTSCAKRPSLLATP